MQEMDAELAVVHGQQAHVAALTGRLAEAVEKYQAVLALNLQADVATHALCSNNAVTLRTQLAEAPPKVRCGAFSALWVCCSCHCG